MQEGMDTSHTNSLPIEHERLVIEPQRLPVQPERMHVEHTVVPAESQRVAGDLQRALLERLALPNEPERAVPGVHVEPQGLPVHPQRSRLEHPMLPVERERVLLEPVPSQAERIPPCEQVLQIFPEAEASSNIR